MPWHPPIPAEIVYRPEAAVLGAGLRLLLYCYNCVGRDGTFTLSLAQATEALEVEYETLRKWWQAIKKTGIITVIQDLGHNGLRVQMRRDWIDWHTHKGNFQRENTTVEGNTSPPQRFLNGSSTVGQRENTTVEDTAYKVLMDSDQAGGGKDQDGTAHSPPHPAVLAYRTAFPHIRLTQKQEAIISALVGERVEHLECWREVIQDYELSTIWRPENIGNMRSRFEKKLKERKTEKRETRPPIPTQTWKPPDDALSGDELRQAIAARTKK